MEEWRTSCFSNEYSVSTMGNVKRNSTGKILSDLSMKCNRCMKCNRWSMGYRRACVIIKGKPKVIHVAREVLSAFHGKPCENQSMHFKDGHRLNCKLENLKWIWKPWINEYFESNWYF